MATTDIRLKRIEKEYQSVRDGQDDILDRIDTYEEALLGLNQTVVANHEWTRRQFAEIRRDVSDLNEKMDRLMAHLNVPPKLPAGFVPD
ncbi:MAG: hypothetical protein OXG53_13750 [Chloroflexi bacterium]|nr:hypothetical protein [Chloroflexota bacterium]